MSNDGVLYAINDTLAQLASEYSSHDTDLNYDQWLNDLTHYVAQELGIEPKPFDAIEVVYAIVVLATQYDAGAHGPGGFTEKVLAVLTAAGIEWKFDPNQ
jgi:hypothetical protein